MSAEVVGTWFLASGATVAIIVLTFSSLRLVPLINAARDAATNGSTRFEQLHRRSVVLNAATLLLVLVAFLGSARALMLTLAGI